GSEEDGDRSGKTEVQGNERDLAIEAKHSNKRHTRIAPVCVLTVRTIRDYGKLSCSLENDLRWYPALI
ncbi:hypothetical protein ACSLO2_27270, partial [Escherichia coli]